MVQTTSNQAASVTTSSSEILPVRFGAFRRVQLVITNISATTVTIAKGDATAVANAGILLTQNQSWVESSDAGAQCWQGAIQAIGSAASTLAIVEMLESV